MGNAGVSTLPTATNPRMSPSTSPRSTTIFIVGPIVFFANFGLLALQLVAPKLLAPFVGSTVETWTCVIGAFLTGIALGNWIGGRVADRFPFLKTVAVLMVLGGLSAFSMIGLYEGTLASGFYKSIPLGPRIPILAFLFCLLPALLISLLTPLTIKLILPNVEHSGRLAGVIFALSTVGCLVGDYITGFVLQAHFSLNTIITIVGASLIALSVPIFFMGRSATATSAVASGNQAPSKEAGPTDGGWDFKGDIRLAYLVVFLASFCGMSLELTGSRLLAPVLGVSLFTWTGIIGVMLAGTACGNYLGGVLADRGVGPALRRFAILCGFLIGAFSGPIACRHLITNFNPESKEWIEYTARGVFAIFGITLVLPGIYLSRSRRGGYVVVGIVGGLLGVLIAHTAIRSLSKSINLESLDDFLTRCSLQCGFDVRPWFIHGIGFIVGAIIALLFIWDAPKPDERTTRSGALSGSLFFGGLVTLAILLLTGIFINYVFMYGAGDIVDKVMAWTFGLFFLPMLALGTISPQVIRLSVADVKSAGRVAGNIYAWSTVGAIVGTFVTGYFLISTLGTYRVLMVLATVLTILSFFIGRLWKNNAMLYAASIVCGGGIFGLFYVGYGTNRYDMETKYYAIKVSPLSPRIRQDFGLAVDQRPRAVTLTLDQLTHSYVDPDDPTWLGYKHEYVQAELLMQALARGEETNLLVIGGGGYTFPRYVEFTLPAVNVEVVEIDPGVTEIAHEKLGLARDTKIRTHNMDGRQFVSERATKGKYQLVMQDAVNDLSVPGHLMTKEYNDAVKAILAPDGAFLLTLIDRLPDGKLWRAAFHTMRETFQYVTLLGPKQIVGPDGSVEADRGVYVIYGSDRPLDIESLPPTILSEGIIRFTHQVDREPMEKLLNDPAHKKLILTDQYCPVDNLMAEVFRLQAKGRR